jgi:hypothetical protein
MQLTTYGKLSAAQYALDNQTPLAEAFAFYGQQCVQKDGVSFQNANHANF